MQRGDAFIVSAPSGAGKTTIIRRVLDGPLGRSGSMVYSVSHTSRAARRGEVDGRDYHFVDTATFERMVEEDAFLEWAEVHGEYKGTARSAIEPSLELGLDVLLDIDVQGAEQLMPRLPGAHGIFILPPSFRELERRIRGRGLDQAEAIARRLGVSLWEIKRYELYQYVIINDNLARASDALAAIILDKRHRLERMGERAKTIVRDFESRLEQDGRG